MHIISNVSFRVIGLHSIHANRCCDLLPAYCSMSRFTSETRFEFIRDALVRSIADNIQFSYESYVLIYCATVGLQWSIQRSLKTTMTTARLHFKPAACHQHILRRESRGTFGLSQAIAVLTSHISGTRAAFVNRLYDLSLAVVYFYFPSIRFRHTTSCIQVFR